MEVPVLALIPSSYNVGKLYSALPINGSGDFDFSRDGIGSRINSTGLMDFKSNNIPRLDYYSNECPALLLEPTRENKLIYSEESQFKTLNNVTLTDNYAISPSGISSAIRVNEGFSNSSHSIDLGNVTVSTNTDYTFSIFVKKESSLRSVVIEMFSGVGSFNLDNQQTTGDLVLLESYSNDWYRIGMTQNSLANTSVNCKVYISQDSTTNSYIGDESTFLLWGTQLEEGNYPSSYIKTEASTIIRTNDICSNAGNSTLFSANKGSLFVDIEPFDKKTDFDIAVSDGTDSNMVRFEFVSGSRLVYAHLVSEGTTVSLAAPFDYSALDRIKILITYKKDELKFYANGNKIDEVFLTSTPINMNRFDFCKYDETKLVEGRVYGARVFNKVLNEGDSVLITTPSTTPSIPQDPNGPNYVFQNFNNYLFN